MHVLAKAVAIVTLTLLSLAPFETAYGAPNCKKGIPCGNSCIAANKTCRIGTLPAATNPQRDNAAAPGPAARAAPLRAAPLPLAAGAALTRSPNELGADWVG